MVVLILSNYTDPHATAVAEHLESVGVDYRIWSYSDFISNTSCSFSIGANRRRSLLRFASGERLSLDDLRSIWFRRPGSCSSPTMPEPWIESMIECESNNVLNGILRAQSCLMVNPPGSDNEALLKIWQLNLAQKVGFRIPESIITNEPEEVSEFYERLGGSIIYKMIGENTNFCFPSFEFPSGIPTLPLRQGDLQYLNQIKVAPHLFQERVKKKLDVRVTVVGESLFAAGIESQGGKSSLDWRMDYSVPMQPIDLPESLSEQCLSIMRVMRLNYAAFDFCVDADDQYFFLELNCAGQYLWQEQRTGQEISKEIALLLAGKAKPLIAPGAVSFETK